MLRADEHTDVIVMPSVAVCDEGEGHQSLCLRRAMGIVQLLPHVISSSLPRAWQTSPQQSYSDSAGPHHLRSNSSSVSLLPSSSNVTYLSLDGDVTPPPAPPLTASADDVWPSSFQ